MPILLTYDLKEKEWNKQPLNKWVQWRTEQQTKEEFENLNWNAANGFAIVIDQKTKDGLYVGVIDWDIHTKTLSPEAIDRGFKILQEFPLTAVDSTISGGLHNIYFSRTPIESDNRYLKQVALELKGRTLIVMSPSQGYERQDDARAILIMEDLTETFRLQMKKHINVIDVKPFPNATSSTFTSFPINGVSPGVIRPCIQALLKNTHLPHDQRLMVAFEYFTAGFSVEDLTLLFTEQADYEEEKTRKQLEQIKRKGYHRYSCKTLQSHGVCTGKEECLFNKPKATATEEHKWTLTLEAKETPIFQPCCYIQDTLVEGAYLSYTDQDGKVEKRPSLIIKRQGGNGVGNVIEVYDLQDPQLKEKAGIDVKGNFPGQLETLMSVEAVKMLLAGETFLPQDIDKELEKVILTHWMSSPILLVVAKRWIEGTFFHHVFDQWGLLNIIGSSESGKTRLLDTIRSTSYHGQNITIPTEAGLYRMKGDDKATLCYDEAEYLNIPGFQALILSILNASYSKGSSVPRYIQSEKGEWIKQQFNLYSPCAISGIKGLPGVTGSRAIPIVSERPPKDERGMEVSTPMPQPFMYGKLRDKLYVLMFQLAFEIRKLYERIDVSRIVGGRFSELFKPLFVLTKVFGTDEEYELLTEWVKYQRDIFKIEALNIPDEEQILFNLAQLEPKTEDWYSLKELTDTVNQVHNRQLKSRTVSQILTRVGISERKRTSDGVIFKVSKERLNAIFQNLSLGSIEQIEATTEDEKKIAKDLEEQKIKDIAVKIGIEEEQVREVIQLSNVEEWKYKQVNNMVKSIRRSIKYASAFY